MRSSLIARRYCALSKASALIAVAFLGAACSSGANRMDQLLTASIGEAPNQQQIVSAQPATQAFPGDVQVIKRTATPIKPAPLAEAVSRSSLPPVSKTHAASVPVAPTVSTPQAVPRSGGIPDAPKGALVLQPLNRAPKPLREASTDELTTGSVIKVKPATTPAVSAKPQPKGWDKTKGARVVVRPGETLHNLSRRYGVPVKAIVAANNLQSADQVVAGSQILIPSYNYAESLGVSAPDNNPITKASRASTGFQGQARGVVAVPKVRGKQVAKQTNKVKKPVDGADYRVVPGDTLYAIARRHKVSAQSIIDANGLETKNLQIGQELNIPDAPHAVVAKKTEPEEVLDHSTTGSIASEEVKPVKVKPVVAKAQKPKSAVVAKAEKTKNTASQSSGGFSWPARGQLISKFGERNESGANDGIDISMPVGTPVKAANAGTVIYSGSELEDFGKLILVSHPGGWVSAYAHASNTLVSRGQKVKRGQVIAKSGKTGNASVPKLHFELRKNSNPVNPLRHLAK